MLDKYLKNYDVIKLIKELRTSERYFNKRVGNSTNSFISMSNDEALYIFYEALYKYKIIIDDDNLFDEYLEQVEKLYRKLNDFDNIRYGINKLICKVLISKFNIKDIEDEDSREKIINYVYKKYIQEGYFIHGFHSSYLKEIRSNGFDPENYENYYDRFGKINDIFTKYNTRNIINKDFLSKNVYFTDDFLMSCYYSNYAPLFYYEFLFDEETYGNRIRKDNCMICDYPTLIRHLKRFMNNNLFRDEDKNYILSVVKDQWDLLHREPQKITLLLVKRNKIFSKDVKVDEFLKDKGNIYDIIDRLLNPKYNNLEHNKFIDKEEFNILELETYYDIESLIKKEKEEEEKYKLKEKKVLDDFNNKYGSVSILLLLGSLLISLGVIITIFTILR
ncbi:MAG: hypothetical protein IJ097_01465 [Bacilli bacterium]|nr:hypothetical protein [Bacilli bacterium]